METENNICLDVVVKICGQMYAVNSRYIISIMNMQKYNPVPGVPKEILGIMNFRSKAVPLLDMRLLFGLPTIKQEFEKFQSMIDDRKADHVRWVEKFAESVNTGEKFTLATDPHLCAFGKWYYHFHSDNASVNHHLRKIEEPHRKLHELALELENKGQEICDANHNLIELAKDKYMVQILGLLDETKLVFQSLYKEMLIVLDIRGQQIAIVVDEVISVEELLQIDCGINALDFQYSDLVCNVKQRMNSEELILELNDERLLERSTLSEKLLEV